ncbi:phage antirepressor KilAC domain-containing protein [Thiobacillus denitrificans]|uniref:Antirepressor protein C-terminal domain-containing protein n=1 Tax=Thiobacillus denitrificans TaxID=36861 RepID=A0A106BIF8_THIDE|nr:phage regulatory protein/antirepressor Ant [Thiobacillus denitrificans]KVW92638.1 hypothetical protein ABW22_15790 [Thiobacillus denitrificans]
MTNLVSLLGGKAVTTSLAIAEGTANEHASVIKLVRTYQADLEEFGRVVFQIAPFETAGGTQQREVAMLNEQQSTLILTYMRNSDIVRKFKKALVRAFFDLMQQAALARFNIPATYPEAMRLAADLAEQKAHAEAQLAIAAPKAQALDRIANADGTMNPTVAAKTLQVQPKKLFDWLREKHWIYRRPGGSSNVAYQDKIQAGYLTHKITTVQRDDGSEKIIEQVLVTGKGLAKISQAMGVACG